MQRPSRYVGGNKKTEGPSNLIFFDTETYREKIPGTVPTVAQRLRLWTAIRVRLERGKCTRRVISSGFTKRDFWGFVDANSDASRRTWMFAHNLGFDLVTLGFLAEMDSGRFTLQPLYRKDKDGNETTEKSWCGKWVMDGQVVFLVVRNGKKTYTMVDTLNYWPTSLWEVGERHGLPKLASPGESCGMDGWKDYCLRDTEIVERAVTKLVTTWTSADCGVFKPTAASLSFTNWQHTCPVRTPNGKSPDVVCEPDAPQHKLERDAYFGGWVQPFYVGELTGPIYHVDVNSLYPYVMRNGLYPRRFVGYGHCKTPQGIRDIAASYGIVASVLVRSRNDTYITRFGTRHYHVRGAYWTVLAGTELARCIDSNHCVRVGQVQIYSVAQLFKVFVDYWYGRKLRARAGRNADPGEYEFCKIILNSLSGKWAQRGRFWLDCPGLIATERWGSWGGGPPPKEITKNLSGQRDSAMECDGESCKRTRYRYRGIGGNTQVEIVDHEPRHSFPAISACITANARDYMYRVVSSLPERSVYYVATDSLLLSESGYRALRRQWDVHHYRLGSFRLIGKHSRGHIYGANHYELDGELTVAGWAAKARIDSTGRSVCEVWDRLQAATAKGPDASITVRTLPLRESKPDYKGTIGKDGWWEPFRLSLDAEFTDKPPARGYVEADLSRMLADSFKG